VLPEALRRMRPAALETLQAALDELVARMAEMDATLAVGDPREDD
jgi:hypothetical protein